MISDEVEILNFLLSNLDFFIWSLATVLFTMRLYDSNKKVKEQMIEVIKDNITQTQKIHLIEVELAKAMNEIDKTYLKTKSENLEIKNELLVKMSKIDIHVADIKNMIQNHIEISMERMNNLEDKVDNHTLILEQHSVELRNGKERKSS